ncbi:MAG: ATP-binding protein [Protaetiibacter sp.]
MTAAAAPAPEARPVRVRPALLRPREVVLGGVSVALGRHLGVPIPLIRVVVAFAAVLGLLGAAAGIVLGGYTFLVLIGAAPVLLYLWFWALVSREPGTPDAPRARAVPVASVLLGAAVVLALVTPLSWGLEYYALPIGLVESGTVAVLAIVWTVAVDARDPRRAASAPLVRSLAAAFLILFGLLLLRSAFADSRPLVAVVGVALVLLGIAAFVLPPLVARWNARAAERAVRARDEQRAEIAAHLHDSVLQTLAIIQNRAGAGSEIARIARAQERELRDWLFAGTDPFAGDLATELRTIARELELEHAVRIEVVTVGEVGAVESHALAAAAREALVNAARHAGGDVTVYAEATPDAVEVFVRDRGPGFDPNAVPDGRLGIRESIMGRMVRAGGTGAVTSGPEGTEVVLRLPRGRAAASGPASGSPSPKGGAA